jgi:hypothetical protein
LDASVTDPKEVPGPSLRLGTKKDKVVIAVALTVGKEAASVAFEFTPEEAGRLAWQLVELGKGLLAAPAAQAPTLILPQ